jgi:hypothetical protein
MINIGSLFAYMMQMNMEGANQMKAMKAYDKTLSTVLLAIHIMTR